MPRPPFTLQLVFGVLLSALPVTGGAQVTLSDQASGTTALLQAVSAVNDRIVWVSGHNATFARSTDGGETWSAGVVPGNDKLQYRDLHAVDANTAYLMSSGTGPSSRIYLTKDGGASWALQFTNPDSLGFYDCMGFWDVDHGLVVGDEVDGHAVVLATEDGGAHWRPLPPDILPAVRTGEGGFAASGTCLITLGSQHAWIGTGAGLVARVLHTPDRGRTWTVAETPIVHANKTSGIFSLAFRDSLNGIALGGDNSNPTGYTENVAVTADGGRTWRLAGRPKLPGTIFGGAYVPGARTPTVVAVGPKGADYSTDGGATWNSLSTSSYWSVGFSEAGVGWMVGPGGRITRLTFRR